MGRLFGTNGVRGVVNKELTVDMVTRLASTVGAHLGKEIALGQDGRTSSPMFKDATVGGLLSIGCNVHDAGLLPTPVLQFSVKHFRLDGGLMVTASHNPPEYNGVKVIASDGVEVSRQQEDEIEESFFSGGLESSPWDRIGKISRLDTLASYKASVLTHIDCGAVQKAGLSVAIDPGNGVAALTAPEIATELGCKVYTINVDVDGRFPGRESEPRPDNLGGLSALVKASGADVGVAFDGDGDRSLFVDEKGQVHWGDRSVALIARDFMEKNPGEEVATPVSSSRVIEDVVKAGGGRVIWTEVGSVVVSRTMVEKGLKLGGEGNGGLMYGPHLEVRDGSMALTLVLGIMAKTGKPLSELFAELPQYSQMKDRVECPEEVKEKALEVLSESVDAPSIENLDGVKLGYLDGSWVLIRPSGTEPIFRIYAESRSPDRVKELIIKYKELVGSVIASLR